MNRLRALMMVAVALVSPSLASAGPVTINFSGQWSFFDPPSDAPEFHAAMAALGIVNGTPLSLSFTVADATTSSSGFYPGALLGGALNVGSLSYAIGQSSFQLSQSCAGTACSGSAHFFTHLFGPTLSGGNRSFYPNFIQFDSNANFAASSSLSSSLASASWQNPFIFVSFWNQPVIPPNFGSQGDMGVSSLAFKSVSVPEPSTLATIAAALVALYTSRRIGSIARG